MKREELRPGLRVFFAYGFDVHRGVIQCVSDETCVVSRDRYGIVHVGHGAVIGAQPPGFWARLFGRKEAAK